MLYLYICKRGLLDKLSELIEPYKPVQQPKPEKPKRITKTINECVEEVKTFCEKNGRLPQPKDGSVFSYWGRLRKCNHPMFDVLDEQYRTRNRWDARLDELKAFVIANRHMPRREKDGSIGHYWYSIRKKHRDDPRVIEIRSLSPYDDQGKRRLLPTPAG